MSYSDDFTGPFILGLTEAMTNEDKGDRMSELDKKLRKVLQNHKIPPGDWIHDDMLKPADSHYHDNIEGAIGQIKAVFTDAGYLRFPQDIQESKLMDAADVRMTGQEWYDRFKAEFQPTDTDCAEFYVDAQDSCEPIEHARRSGRFEVMMEAEDAAQRAAGITEPKEDN